MELLNKYKSLNRYLNKMCVRLLETVFHGGIVVLSFKISQKFICGKKKKKNN